MDIRTWVYGVLSGDPAIADPVTTNTEVRIYPVNVLNSVPDSPYIVYKIMPEIPENIGAARRTQLQVWVHDDSGSYLQIDDLLEEIKRAFMTHPNEGDFLQARWLDDSEDLFDEGTNTISRYTRLDLVQAR